jgi:hypothetical protein
MAGGLSAFCAERTLASGVIGPRELPPFSHVPLKIAGAPSVPFLRLASARTLLTEAAVLRDCPVGLGVAGLVGNGP